MSPSESGHEKALSGELGAWQDPKTGLFPPKDVDPSGDPSYRANCPWPDCRRVIQGNKYWQHVLLPHYPCDKPPAQFSFISIDAWGRERRKYRCCFWTCGKDFFSKASLTKHQKTCEGRLKFGMPLAGYNLQANLQRARPGATEAEVDAVFDIVVRRYIVIQGLTFKEDSEEEKKSEEDSDEDYEPSEADEAEEAEEEKEPAVKPRKAKKKISKCYRSSGRL